MFKIFNNQGFIYPSYWRENNAQGDPIVKRAGVITAGTRHNLRRNVVCSRFFRGERGPCSSNPRAQPAAMEEM